MGHHCKIQSDFFDLFNKAELHALPPPCGENISVSMELIDILHFG